MKSSREIVGIAERSWLRLEVSKDDPLPRRKDCSRKQPAPWKNIAEAYGEPALAQGLIWLDDHEFYAKVKMGKQRHLFRHNRTFDPFPKQGDESKYRDVLKLLG